MSGSGVSSFYGRDDKLAVNDRLVLLDLLAELKSISTSMGLKLELDKTGDDIVFTAKDNIRKQRVARTGDLARAYMVDQERKSAADMAAEMKTAYPPLIFPDEGEETAVARGHSEGKHYSSITEMVHDLNSEYDVGQEAVAVWDEGKASVDAPSKYHVVINGGYADVYAVLNAYRVACPATQHAIKKLLMPGARGHKTKLKDLTEARHSIDRAIELAEAEETANEVGC